MPQIRMIETVWKSVPTLEGAGVYLKRAFGNSQVPKLDPFLLLDDFHSAIPADYLPGFPWHPHRGIETITYVLEGNVEHEDSLGHAGVITSGDVQWMTAGSGIIHQEMPQGGPDDKSLWGFQLWANLPSSQKMMEPRYRDVKRAQIPQVQLPSGVILKVVCGSVQGVSGPVRDIVIEPEYLDVSVPPHAVFDHSVKPGHTVFVYVADGKGYFDPRRDAYSFEVVGSGYGDFERECRIGAETLVLYEPQGDRIEVTTEADPVRFLLVSGKPIGEPVAWYGPIVMNTKEELRIAFEEYRKGAFIKHGVKPAFRS